LTIIIIASPNICLVGVIQLNIDNNNREYNICQYENAFMYRPLQQSVNNSLAAQSRGSCSGRTATTSERLQAVGCRLQQLYEELDLIDD